MQRSQTAAPAQRDTMMSAVGGGHGSPAGRRPRVGSDGDASRPTSTASARFAAGVLEDLYAVVYGERPVGVRSGATARALLMVLRLAGPGRRRRSPPARLGDAAVRRDPRARRRPPCARRPAGSWRVGSWSVEAELGLAMFVFRLPAAGPPPTRLARRGARALDDGEPGQRRSGRLSATHVPSWRSWTPVPSGGVVPGVRRRRPSGAVCGSSRSRRRASAASAVR